MNSIPSDFPELTSDAFDHSERVRLHIEQIISDQGAIAFSRFMHEALYAPGLGYYASGAQKFGSKGDFVTAPEISSLFGQCLAEQVLEVINWCDGGDVLELGAGSGRLACDMITAFKKQAKEPNHYYILEPSAELQSRQKKLLHQMHPDWQDRIVWLDSLPAAFIGIIVGNEVMDAFPVERFSLENKDLIQWYVNAGENGFEWEKHKASAQLEQAVKMIEGDLNRPLNEDVVSEVNLYLSPWIKSLSDCLTQGAIVLLDYGHPVAEYYHPERTSGTLQCFYAHHKHDNPLILPGVQDITAHVNFSALVSAAVDAGLELEGLTSQAQFLLSTGILKLAEEGEGDSIIEQTKRSKEIQQLTLPSEMGERFMAIGFSRGLDDLLCGFTGQDLSHRL